MEDCVHRSKGNVAANGQSGIKTTVGEGVIDEHELVAIFATEKQKAAFAESGHRFKGGKQKETILRQAARYCEIEDMGNREYKILRVHKYPVPKNFAQMKEGLHKYLTPMILINLIASGIYEVKNLTFTMNRWYRMVDLINSNYVGIKFNMDYGSRKLGVGRNALCDFFNATDDSLVYYFKKSLEYLKTANLFNFQEINWLCARRVEIRRDESGKQFVDIKSEHRRATAAEMVYIRRCEEKASKHVGIGSDDEAAKYYGKKSGEYAEKLKELLLERDILFCYKAYEIYSTDYDIQKCYQLLGCFEIEDKDRLVELAYGYFRDNLLRNMGKRVACNPEKRSLFTEAEKERFFADYEKVLEYTLNPSVKHMAIPDHSDSAEMGHVDRIIEDNLEVRYRGRTLKVGVKEETCAD